VRLADLPTPALVVDVDVLETNLATMAAVHPGARLRPHVKAHKCTSLAHRQRLTGHHAFTCATVREVLGMTDAALGDDLLLANEVVDPVRLRALAAAQEDALITVAVDSEVTIDAAATAGLRHVLIDVNIGLPRCGCAPTDAGRLADHARRRGLDVRGVMGYEGHLMIVEDRVEQRAAVHQAMEVLVRAHADVGGDIISCGGTGTHDLLAGTGITEVQAGSYALMDSHYARLGLPFGQALHVLGTVISVSARWAVADVGLKALGMDHGNPSIRGHRVWFCSDEHVTFSPDDAAIGAGAPGVATDIVVGDRVVVVPAHVDPTMALHEAVWAVRGDEVVDRWPIDLRSW
jgi:D-serine deaminase-like pyridoxal phosphate-dependent protein